MAKGPLLTGAALTVMVKVPVAMPAALVALMVTRLLCTVVGVPLMVRLGASKLSPAGSPLAEYVMGAVPLKAGTK